MARYAPISHAAASCPPMLLALLLTRQRYRVVAARHTRCVGLCCLADVLHMPRYAATMMLRGATALLLTLACFQRDYYRADGRHATTLMPCAAARRAIFSPVRQRAAGALLAPCVAMPPAMMPCFYACSFSCRLIRYRHETQYKVRHVVHTHCRCYFVITLLICYATPCLRKMFMMLVAADAF